MKLHKGERGLRCEECWWYEIWEIGEPGANPKNKDSFHHRYHYAGSKIQTRNRSL